MSFIRLSLLAFAMALFAAACGGGGDDDAPDGDQPDPGQMTKVESVAAGAPEIDQDSLKFKPNSLEVRAGQTVYFKNSESAIHTVTISGKNLSNTMKKDEVRAWIPPAPGTYKITCDYHPQMRSTVTVAP